MGTKVYTIGELARLSGQSVRRIRYYSDKGLLPPSDRSAGNYRIYSEADVARLDLITPAKPLPLLVPTTSTFWPASKVESTVSS